ncbi:MAG: ATP-binding cassette domain-containing protein [Capsulimonadaceae bacterium]|nr:ATP-binding cassette domain-containing protein [Capsulimonadaceae bacterium]
MIIVSDVTKSYGTRILFESVSVKFSPGNRYGLTGPNGAGKSTFLKILTGEIEPSNRGKITRPKRVGVMRQDQFAFDNEKIIDTVMMGNAPLWDALKERDALYAAGEFTDPIMERLGDLESIVADENGYMAEIDAAEILRGIGLTDDRHNDLMKSLPTDYKFRVLLAQALFGNPQALLLDEPTNHMDLDGIHWLEAFLQEYDGTMIVISHDRHFLNAICTHIADIDYETVIVYPGSYDDMVEHKMQAHTRMEAENRDKAKKIAQLQEFVSRFAAGQRSSQVQSRRKEMLRLAPTELKRSNIQRPYIRFDQNKAPSREVVTVKGLNKSFGDNHVLKDITLEVARGEKIAIIGPNGVGKTTLLRCLIGELRIDSGEIRWGHGMDKGYYAQDFADQIDRGMSAIDYLMQYETGEGYEIIRGLMGRMLFSGDEALKLTDNLSGGELARLKLAQLMIGKPPVLVFDEPTNHLDLESVNALGEGLSLFEGTVFVVTHDQDLITDVATRILRLSPGEFLDFHGTWEEYLEQYPLLEREHHGRKG